MTASKTSKRTRIESGQLKAHILEAFSAKAKREGIRNVMMAELASELRMSASTLYKLYPSKEALTLACVDRWADDLGAAEAAKPDPSAAGGFEHFMHWVDAWADANARLSPAFRHDLASDYPLAWRRYSDVIRERKERGAALLLPLLKPELDRRVAFAVLNMIFEEVVRPEFADRLRISRKEAIRSALTIWAAGALQRRGKLRSLRTRK